MREVLPRPAGIPEEPLPECNGFLPLSLFALDGLVPDVMAKLGCLGPRGAHERPGGRGDTLQQLELDLILWSEARDQGIDPRLERRGVLPRQNGHLGRQAVLETIESRPALAFRRSRTRAFLGVLAVGEDLPLARHIVPLKSVSI